MLIFMKVYVFYQILFFKSWFKKTSLTLDSLIVRGAFKNISRSLLGVI